MKASDVVDNKAELIKVLGNISNIHWDKGIHLETLVYYEKVLEYNEKMGNDKEIAITYYCIAEESLSLINLPDAITNLQAAIYIMPISDKLSNSVSIKTQ